jgi:hypothetical protein
MDTLYPSKSCIELLVGLPSGQEFPEPKAGVWEQIRGGWSALKLMERRKADGGLAFEDGHTGVNSELVLRPFDVFLTNSAVASVPHELICQILTHLLNDTFDSTPDIVDYRSFHIEADLDTSDVPPLLQAHQYPNEFYEGAANVDFMNAVKELVRVGDTH